MYIYKQCGGQKTLDTATEKIICNFVHLHKLCLLDIFHLYAIKFALLQLETMAKLHEHIVLVPGTFIDDTSVTTNHK